MTTIELGVTRHGPRAPTACQLGKNDVFTSTGVPGASTSKLIRSSVCEMLEITAWRTGVRGGVLSPALTRLHPLGPLAASGTSNRAGSWYQLTAMSCHPVPVVGDPWSTTGSYCIGATVAVPAISNTSHVRCCTLEVPLVV